MVQDPDPAATSAKNPAREGEPVGEDRRPLRLILLLPGVDTTKTYTNLYPTVCSPTNLFSAYTQCRRGKGDKSYVTEFEKHLQENLDTLAEALQSRTWTPKGYSRFYVNDPKRRLINAPAFEDRIVHRALYDVIMPPFERGFYPHSYACRRGKGAHAGVACLRQYLRQYSTPPYYLQIDIKSYFASIHHDTLMAIIRRKIADSDVLALIRKILDSYHDSPGTGIPLGNLTSQLFANIYLNELDHYVKHVLRCRHYIRYMDDIILLSETKAQLWEWKAAIEEFIARLRLRLHPRKQVVAPARCGIDFLGYVIYPDHVRVRNRNIHRVYDRMKRIEAGTYPRDPRGSIMSWMGYSIHADAHGLNQSIQRKHPFLVLGTEKFYGRC